MKKKIKAEEYMNWDKNLAKELSPLEALDKIARRLAFGGQYTPSKQELDIIETALKNYQELLKKPCVLVGRTNGRTQALVDMISKNYKEIKITNLDDEKKLKAFEIAKEKKVDMDLLQRVNTHKAYNFFSSARPKLSKNNFNLLKEALK